MQGYRNNLKNREFGKEAPQNSQAEALRSERPLLSRQVASEHENFEGKPTPPKTNSSGCFGIKQSETISFNDFLRVDIRVGTIIKAEVFPEARKPAYKLEIDFGKELGVKRSSAQITQHYQLKDLVGKQVIAVVNFPPKQIGKFFSQVLTLGLADEAGHIVLLEPTQKVPNGARLF